ncbi:MAG: rRNA adenine N-6-methyltransferase family protein [Candidatus Nanoarchaeia archaeon]
MTTILDQHFLNNTKILKTILDTINSVEKHSVLEIGGGKGILTQKIIQKQPLEFTCVEIDEQLFKTLQPLFMDTNYTLLYENAITYLQQLQKDTFSIIVGNIPYSITQALYTQLLYLLPQKCVFLQPHSFTQQLLESSTKQTQFINANYEVYCIQVVKGEHFTPKAKTTSSIVELKRKTNIDKSRIEKFISHISKRYNQQFNNAIIFSLAMTLQKGKKEIKNELKKHNIEISTSKVSIVSNQEFNATLSKIEEIFLNS